MRICKIVKSTYFTEHLWVTASEIYPEQELSTKHQNNRPVIALGVFHRDHWKLN